MVESDLKSLTSSQVIGEFFAQFPEYEANKKIISRYQTILSGYQNELNAVSYKGSDFFLPEEKLPILPPDEQLPEEAATSFVHLFVYTDALHDAAQTIEPKAVGLALKYIVDSSPETFRDIIAQTPVTPDENEWSKQLTRLSELFLLTNPNASITDTLKLARNSELNSHLTADESINLANQATRKATINLFEKGLITSPFKEIFATRNMWAILNEVEASSLPALEVLYQCATDEYTKKDFALYVPKVIATSILGVDVRNGLPLHKEIYEEAFTKDDKDHLQLLLYSLTADLDSEPITYPEVLAALEGEFPEVLREAALEDLVRYNTPIHPNSFLAHNLEEYPLTLNEHLLLQRIIFDLEEAFEDELDNSYTALLSSSISEDFLLPRMLSELIFSSIAMEKDIPPYLQEFLSHERFQQDVAEAVFSSFPFRMRQDHMLTWKYPTDPQRTLLTKGLSVLPQFAKDALTNGNPDYDTIGVGIMDQLFTKNAELNSFYKHFFVQDQTRPLPEKGYGRVKDSLWELVHPDIWDLLRKADERVLVSFIQDFSPSGEVPLTIQGRSRSKSLIVRSTLDKCLPPDIFSSLVEYQLENATPQTKTLWTEASKTTQQGEIDLIKPNKATSRPFASLHEAFFATWKYTRNKEITPEYIKEDFANNLWQLPKKYGVSIEIFNPDSQKWVVIPSQKTDETTPPETTLVINDPVTYIQQYFALKSMQRRNWPWDRSVTPANIMWNATREDFLNPVDYIKGLIHQTKDLRLLTKEGWTSIGHAEELGETVYKQFKPSEGFYESPYTLHFSLAAGVPTNADEIPLVRYGFVDKNTAVVYAVQMPIIDRFSQGTLNQSREAIVEYPATVQQVLKGLSSELATRVVPLFFTLENNDLAPLSEEMVKEYLETASLDEKTNQIKKALETLREEEYENASDFVLLETLIELFNTYSHHKTVLQFEPQFVQRAERMKRLNNVFKEERKSKSEETRNLPSGPVLSLALFCIEAKKAGATTIKIPTLFPLRQHEDETIDQRILDQTGRMIDGLCYVLHGVSIRSYPDADGYFQLSIADELQSTNPLLKSVLESQ